MADNNNETLIKKYFPKEWKDLILPEKIKESLVKISSNKGYRLLLYSSPGTGKTTTARLLTKNDSVMYLSGSNDFNIHVMREKVYSFASGMSQGGKRKTIIIDEFENVKDNLQDAFKITLDQSVNVNFIFITNEVEKIIGAIKSRCTPFDYDFSEEHLVEQKRNYIIFIKKVCDECGLKYDVDGMREMRNRNFPDFRHALVNLQQIIDMNETVSKESVRKCVDIGKQNLHLYDLVENRTLKSSELYSELSQYRGTEKDCFLSLGEPFFRYLNEKDMHDKTLEVALVVSKYCDSYNSTINKFVTLTAAITELRTLFR